MDMVAPPAIIQFVQAEAPAAIQVDISRYVPDTAVSATIIVSVLPPTGSALVYAPEHESYAVLFKGPKSSGEVRLSGPFIYVQLIDGASAYRIQYLGWREP